MRLPLWVASAVGRQRAVICRTVTLSSHPVHSMLDTAGALEHNGQQSSTEAELVQIGHVLRAQRNRGECKEQ